MKPFPTLLALHLALAAFAGAQDPSANELKLREALRNTMLQLRTAQTETANAQAAVIAAEQKIQGLETKVAGLEKRTEDLVAQSNEDRAASEKTIATLNNRLADRDNRLAEYVAAIDKWKAGYESAAAAARKTGAEREKLADEAIVLRRTIEDRERKNIALFNLSREILDRYENHALGRSIAAREPFISSARVKVENLVQGYKDRLLDNRLNQTKP